MHDALGFAGHFLANVAFRFVFRDATEEEPAIIQGSDHSDVLPRANLVVVEEFNRFARNSWTRKGNEGEASIIAVSVEH